jgi:hypothetical protein
MMMEIVRNPKWKIGTVLMVLGLTAQFGSFLFHPLRAWLSAIYIVAFSTGLILRIIAWKEEKKAQQSS